MSFCRNHLVWDKDNFETIYCFKYCIRLLVKGKGRGGADCCGRTRYGGLLAINDGIGGYCKLAPFAHVVAKRAL